MITNNDKKLLHDWLTTNNGIADPRAELIVRHVDNYFHSQKDLEEAKQEIAELKKQLAESFLIYQNDQQEIARLKGNNEKLLTMLRAEIEIGSGVRFNEERWHEFKETRNL